MFSDSSSKNQAGIVTLFLCTCGCFLPTAHGVLGDVGSRCSICNLCKRMFLYHFLGAMETHPDGYRVSVNKLVDIFFKTPDLKMWGIFSCRKEGVWVLLMKDVGKQETW